MSKPDDIQKLIRLKRYEQPPEGYFDDFLYEFQRRQRAEMLQRSVWQIAWDRVNLWLDGFRVPAIAYASILVAALGIGGLIVGSQDGDNAQPTLASNSVETPAPASVAAPVNVTGPVANVSTLPPSYILEKRPVSYEAPFSF